MHIILINETIPNSTIILELVNTNVPKPRAVVALVRKVALPTFWIINSKDLILLLLFLNSCWYLLIKKMAFGTPITIINGGIKAIKTVISYLNKPIKPNAQTTPMLTTNSVIAVALKDLKKKKK
mgnify:CR=1 FL=1